MDIDILIKENQTEKFAILLLNAFETYHRDESLDGMKKLFGNYFCENDRIDDFMTQLKLKFFDNLNITGQLFFSEGYSSAFSKYDISKHHKGTLYFLLDFMLYSNTYNIFPSLDRIWKKLENQNFEDENRRSFALEILRYVASANDIDRAYNFMLMVYSSKKFHLDFAVQVLLVVAKYNINTLPYLIKKYSDMGWMEYENGGDFFDMMIEYITDEIGLSTITNVLNEFDESALWFVEKLFSKTKVSLDTENIDNPRYDLITPKETVTIFNISKNLENMLVFFLNDNSPSGKSLSETPYITFISYKEITEVRTVT